MAIRDEQKVRLSAVAGMFYEGDALLLRRQLAEIEGKLPPPESGIAAAKGVILPHAGYVFSLATAMAALAPLRKQKVGRVIVLGPSHYVGFRGVAAADFTRWRTPFGDLSTATDLLEKLEKANSPLVTVRDDAHDREHSLEVQLPLVQYFFGQPEVLPLVVGSLSMEDVRALAPKLAALDSAETLWIISSDFTHYGSRFRYVPFTENVAERLRDQDHAAAGLVAKRDLEGFAAFLGRTGATICGMNPIALFLGILDELDPERKIHGEIAAEANSGELTGDYSNAVGYESIRFTR